MSAYNLQNIKSAYIAYATDSNIRYKGSSGGVGSAIINYLFDSNTIQSAITLQYNKELCRYEPKIVYKREDYIQTGSVYHDIIIPKFISVNIDKIKGKIAVFCPPCFVNAVRNILDKHNIESIIISFACSGQTNIEGTYFYYKCLDIKKENVDIIQYRGNGFPSGIQITLKNGTKIFRKNWTYPWDIIQASKLFQPKRCFFCQEQMNAYSDFSIADPWLPKFESDESGYSIITVNTENAKKILEELQVNNIVSAKKIDIETVIASQKDRFFQKSRVKYNLSLLKKEYKICSNRIYKHIILSSILFIKLHNSVLNLIHKFFK